MLLLKVLLLLLLRKGAGRGRVLFPFPSFHPVFSIGMHAINMDNRTIVETWRRCRCDSNGGSLHDGGFLRYRCRFAEVTLLRKYVLVVRLGLVAFISTVCHGENRIHHAPYPHTATISSSMRTTTAAAPTGAAADRPAHLTTATTKHAVV